MTRITENQPLGTPTWLDYGVPDLDRGKEFYTALFGWTYQDMGAEAGNYNLCFAGGVPVAAIMRNMDENPTDFWWQVHFATDDVDGTVKRITDAGGAVVMPADDVFDQGRMAVAVDPVGAQFGLWQGRAHVGAGIVNEPGTLIWNDLNTAQTDRARTFYKDVFGLTPKPVPGMPESEDYTTVERPDGRMVGGIYGVADAPKSWWESYFCVEDTDASSAIITSGGGTAREPMDTPYGRIVEATDPFGARFGIIRPPADMPES